MSVFFILEKMKCLLCSSNFEKQQKLIDHYLQYHNVDQNNWFFKKLFVENNKAFLKNCVRCNQFITTKKEKAAHDFLKHYNDGKNIPFEERPLDIIKYPALVIYQIEFKKWGPAYHTADIQHVKGSQVLLKHPRQ